MHALFLFHNLIMKKRKTVLIRPNDLFVIHVALKSFQYVIFVFNYVIYY